MRTPSKPIRRMTVTVAVAAVAMTAVAAVALGATDSRAPKVKIRCPRAVLHGRKVTCRLFGRLPHGPAGPQGPRGPKGSKGAKGDKGATGAKGAAGVSGYEVVNQTFKEVAVQNSGGGLRGLSEVKTVSCPTGKRVIGGGSDLGTNAAQSEQQRQVTISLSAPNGPGTGWSVQLFNSSTTIDTSIDLQVYAICADAS
jgi:collagen triple helix repeat protein